MSDEGEAALQRYLAAAEERELQLEQHIAQWEHWIIGTAQLVYHHAQERRYLQSDDPPAARRQHFTNLAGMLARAAAFASFAAEGQELWPAPHVEQEQEPEAEPVLSEEEQAQYDRIEAMLAAEPEAMEGEAPPAPWMDQLRWWRAD